MIDQQLTMITNSVYGDSRPDTSSGIIALRKESPATS